MVFRIDKRGGSLGTAEVTPTGALRAPATLSRGGILEYRRDGRIVREYRPPEENLRADTLATLRDAPVTDRHPPEAVTVRNARRYRKGHVSGEARADGSGDISALLVIDDEDLLGAVMRGDRREISLGYHADLDPTPGVTPEGERYDAIQRNIRVNHVAIVEAGRAGPDYRLRLDSAGDVTEATEMKITLGGKTYNLDDASDLASYQTAVAALEARADAADKRADRLQATIDAGAAKRDDAADAARFDAAVSEYSEALVVARGVLGEGYRADAKRGVDGIRRDVCAKLRPAVKLDGKSPDYVSALFDLVREDATGARADAKIDAPADKPADKPDPRATYRKDQEERGTRPLAIVKG